MKLRKPDQPSFDKAGEFFVLLPELLLQEIALRKVESALETTVRSEALWINAPPSASVEITAHRGRRGVCCSGEFDRRPAPAAH